ncbi:G-patch domain and KOW motifs-containing protein-like [Dreissena polymorpha]|uniref:G-patch domain and KOW motifs-containing protein-like n=1 Tax=Dreissena polymorpha TaxID=45954 RepID=UPI0022643CE8|nr:G-patch domain and KOW motifs-containing protein-like [Dreissena polymorpha]
MSEEGKTSISFGFSKKSEKKTLTSSISEQETNETEFITSLEDREVQSTKPKQEKKEIVIPLIKTNNWKTKQLDNSKHNKSNDGLESQAVQELLKDAEKQKESWDSRGTVDTGLEIPLLMQNKVPEGFETDDQLDVSLRPDEPADTDYEEIPIEAFGLAMLKGMGWKEGEGIGRNNKAVKPVEAVLRPKGMGLGADRGQAQDLNKSKQGSDSKNNGEDSAELRLKKGAYCLVESGPNKDLYGVIEGMDEDNARLMIKLTISGKLVSVSQYNTKLVSAEDYQKYSKYINKGAADRYKKKDELKKEKETRESSSHEDTTRRDRGTREGRDSRDRDERSRDKHDRKKDMHREREREREGSSSSSSKKRKYEDDRPASSHSNGHSSSNNERSQLLWVRPNLRARLVDEKYKKGKYFNVKVVIVDVFDKDHCVCKTEDGKILEDISQTMLETIVPKSDSAYVSIVSGKYRGQIAHVLGRDKKKYSAMLQLLSDRDKVLQIDYDSICEFVGDINEEFDF